MLIEEVMHARVGDKEQLTSVMLKQVSRVQLWHSKRPGNKGFC